MSKSTCLSDLIEQWLSEGFVAIKPKPEKRPFGYHRVVRDSDLKIVPCPNCDAPNEHSNFLGSRWQLNSETHYADPGVDDHIAWLKTPEGEELIDKVGNAKAYRIDGVHVLSHPSRYDTAACKICGCDVIIPGGHLNCLTKKKDRREWYYKPCPVPPKIEYDIEVQLDVPVWFEHWREDGQIVKELRRSDVTLREMIADHFTVNVHTGSVNFFIGWSIDHWGRVRLRDYTGNDILLTGNWIEPTFPVDDRNCVSNPLHRRLEIFVLGHCYLGSRLPPEAQVDALEGGLASELAHHFNALEECVSQYVQDNNFDLAFDDVRFERERRRLAARRPQKSEPADPRQKSLF
ncbi:MAG: hypothetical protein ISS57_18135 [Anaerolineales bacterium]|nr:hypothetical protein [Anaerolineales bacterium]